MNPDLSIWMNLSFRWIHVVAGITWIGHLYFFNFVNSRVMPALDADVKRKVVPELLPRALYWFRWTALWTWVTGILLLGLVYSMGGALVEPDAAWTEGSATLLAFAVLLVGFMIYDLMWLTPMKNMPFAGAIVSLIMLAALARWLGGIFTGRGMFIVIGALLGTCMAANVWMRIWPCQKRIIRAIAGGEKPDGQRVAMATIRSKHNTYMSVPLVFLMVSNHYPTLYGSESGWAICAGMILLGFMATWLLYKKSGSPATAAY